MLNRKLHGPEPGQIALRAAAAMLLVAAALLLVLRLPAEAQANDRDVSGVTLTSPNPGELVITWDAPSRAPNDYRLTWKKSDGKWHSYKNANTVDGGNAYPTGTSYTVTGLEEGTAYQARVRARYHDGDGNLEQSGPWSDAAEITISATPSQDGDGDSNEGPSTSPPSKPAGLITAASHDSVLLAWDNPDDDGITGYQVLRGPDADNLVPLVDDSGDADTSYTDDTVEAETTYVYAVRGRNADGLSPQSDPVSVTTPAAPPAKPTGLITAASHDSVLLTWDNPDDDTITGYQILRGDDADSLAVLLDDTGSATSSYTDSNVVEQTTYVYAVRARNARGLGPQSDPVTVTTSAVPEEDKPPTSARALAQAEFTLAGQDLDTSDSNCLEDTIGDITDACTINVNTTTAIFAVDGTLDSNDRISVKIGRDKAAVDSVSAVADESNLVGTDREVELTFQVGRNLMRLWGDEDGSPGGSEVHFYRVNVLPYWELNGDRLSKIDDCRSSSDRTAAQITDDDCIVTQFGTSAKIQFHNVIKDQFNVYVHVNGIEVIREPGNTALAGPFTLDLQDGDNVVKVRLADKRDSHFSEDYGSDRFHYKVKATDVLVSNLGQSASAFITIQSTNTDQDAAIQFTTGSETNGYLISQVRLDMSASSGTSPRVSIYSDSSGQPGSSLKVLTNSGTITNILGQVDFGADNYGLNPSTHYWIVVERASGIGGVFLRVTNSRAEDTGSAVGWSIGDNGSYLSGGTWSTLTGGITIPRIAVKGTVAQTSASDDATLSALALTDASDNAVTLDPTFASDTTSYRATVANSISRIKVKPTANDSGATIEYLDDSDMTLADADTSTADVFDFVLVEGANVVKVKVTAEDRTTTKTYQVTVTREATTPGAPASLTASAGNAEATLTWTAPASDGGAAITKYQYRVSVDGGTTWAPDWTDVPDGSDSGSDQGDERTVTVTSLVNDSLHTFQVRAVNSEGDGSEIEATATPTATVVTPTASDDATLSALALTDASNNAVALTPAFASSTTSYSATVDNSVSRIKMEPTTNDSNANIEYLDASDSTLPDEDTNTAVFDFDLSEGENVVKVKVTAEDSTTTKTYTVTVTRDSATAATGAPTITGTATVHQTLTAETTNISDVDGLTGASFSYQWIRVDTDGSESDIAGAVSSTYVPTGDDEGKRLKVRVSFDDDNSNSESLTSAATAAVSPSPCTVEGALRFNGSLPSAIDVVIGDSDWYDGHAPFVVGTGVPGPVLSRL